MAPIRPIGGPQEGTPPVPAVRRLTPKEREEAARERQKRRRERASTAPPHDEPHPGSGSLDIRA
jgi:hypothetical protein